METIQNIRRRKGSIGISQIFFPSDQRQGLEVIVLCKIILTMLSFIFLGISFDQTVKNIFLDCKFIFLSVKKEEFLNGKVRIIRCAIHNPIPIFSAVYDDNKHDSIKNQAEN